jgi:hypothetical protein
MRFMLFCTDALEKNSVEEFWTSLSAELVQSDS